MDIKKLGRLREGGGWRAHGRDSAERRAALNAPRVGYEYVHSAVDDHSRLAYSEVLADERADTVIGFWTRAHAFFTAAGITITRVLTDNGACYRSHLWRDTLRDAGITHKRTRPYRPQTNGKVERFNRTLAAEWAYADTYLNDEARCATYQAWLHHYNHHRPHTGLGGQSPIERVSVHNAPRNYS